jgi:PEP-CTERM motif
VQSGVIALCALVAASVFAPHAKADYIFAGSAPYQATVGAWWTPFFDTASTEPARNWSYSRYKAYYKNNANQLTLGQYDSSNVNNMDYQIAQMQSAGINFALSDLTNGVGTGLTNTVSFMDRGTLAAAAAIGGPLWNNAGLTQNQVNQQAIAEADAVWNNLAGKSNYIKYQGKPLLVTYMNYDQGKSNVKLPYWYDYRYTIERATGLIDPANPALDFAANGYNWDSWWGWQSKATVASPTAMTVSPGYDTVHFRGSAGVQLDRQNGQTYMDQWIQSMKTDPDVIMIASWNDYNEENHIEPSEPLPGAPLWTDANGYQTSDLYLKITRAYTALQSNRLLEGYYYKDQVDSSIYLASTNSLTYIGSMSQILPNSPVIVLPDDWLTQIRTTGSITTGSGAQVPEPNTMMIFSVAAAVMIRSRRRHAPC